MPFSPEASEQVCYRDNRAETGSEYEKREERKVAQTSAYTNMCFVRSQTADLLNASLVEWARGGTIKPVERFQIPHKRQCVTPRRGQVHTARR